MSKSDIMYLPPNEWGYFRKFYSSLVEAMEDTLADPASVLTDSERQKLTELLLVARVLKDQLFYKPDHRWFFRDWGYDAGDFVTMLRDR